MKKTALRKEHCRHSLRKLQDKKKKKKKKKMISLSRKDHLDQANSAN